MACRATMKLNDILEEAQETRDKIKEVESNPDYEDKYTAEDAKKDLTINYVQTGVKVAKLYAPAVAVSAAGVGCVLASHDIMKKRNVALSAAYLTVDKSFKEYKQRVVDRFGEEVEKEIRYGIKAEEIVETVTDEEGNETTVT